MALDLNLFLLVVELILLVPTLLLIVLGRREERGRRSLISELTTTAKMVSRQEYFNNVIFGMQTATLTIKGSVTGSIPKNIEQDEVVGNIIEQIRMAKSRGIQVQYLLLKSHDRLPIASRYRLAGAEIAFHSSLLVSDLRYVVFDRKYVLIGLPSSVGENEPTREGYLIPSEGMAEIFLQQFDSKWGQAIQYDEYLTEVLLEAKNHSPNASVSLLSTQLKVPESEVKRVLEAQASETPPSNSVR